MSKKRNKVRKTDKWKVMSPKDDDEYKINFYKIPDNNNKKQKIMYNHAGIQRMTEQQLREAQKGWLRLYP